MTAIWAAERNVLIGSDCSEEMCACLTPLSSLTKSLATADSSQQTAVITIWVCVCDIPPLSLSHTLKTPTNTHAHTLAWSFAGHTHTDSQRWHLTHITPLLINWVRESPVTGVSTWAYCETLYSCSWLKKKRVGGGKTAAWETRQDDWPTTSWFRCAYWIEKTNWSKQLMSWLTPPNNESQETTSDEQI